MSWGPTQVQQGRSLPRCTPSRNVGGGAAWAATETGREARFYALTEVGLEQLEEPRASWDRLSAAVSGVLRTAE